MGQNVTFASDGGQTPGYLSAPKGPPGPGVIVIQEWWGLVPHIRQVCDRFAETGFVALAPDLYHGKTTTSPDEAGRMMMALQIDQAERDLAGAVRYLATQAAGPVEPKASKMKVGCVGFCMGGQLALFAASRNPSIGACVDFYGIHPNVRPDYRGLQGPVLGFFGGRDGSVTPEAARRLERDIRAAGRETEFYVYPDAGHAFFNDSRPEVYHAERAREAWEKMIAFFRRHLGGTGTEAKAPGPKSARRRRAA